MEDWNEIFKIRPISAEDKKYIITIGNKRVSNKTFKSRIEARKYINGKGWDLITSLIIMIIKNYKEATKEELPVSEK